MLKLVEADSRTNNDYSRFVLWNCMYNMYNIVKVYEKGPFNRTNTNRIRLTV